MSRIAPSHSEINAHPLEAEPPRPGSREAHFPSAEGSLLSRTWRSSDFLIFTAHVSSSKCPVQKKLRTNASRGILCPGLHVLSTVKQAPITGHASTWLLSALLIPCPILNFSSSWASRLQLLMPAEPTIWAMCSCDLGPLFSFLSLPFLSHSLPHSLHG